MAEQYIADQKPPNTKIAYEADWKVWRQYCAAVGIPELTGTVGALVGFVRWLEVRTDDDGNPCPAAPNTIDRRLTGAVVTLKEQGVEITKDARRAATDALNGYRRRLAEAGIKRGRGKAPATQVKHLRAIVAACPDTPAGLRDRALMLLGFAIAARRSELAALDVADVELVDDGLLVTVRWSKTGAREVAAPYGQNPETCPVRAWLAWLKAAKLTEGAAFRRIDRHGNMDGRLSGQAVGAIVTRAGKRAGLEVRFTGHSVRSGLATEARRAGHDAKTIATQGGWSPTSRVLYGYMEIVDRWADNAVIGTGL